jgi:hypothetical protein
VKELKTFLFTEEAVQRVKCEKNAEQAVLKVEVKTEVEEDRDQTSENKVRITVLILPFVMLKHSVHYDDFFIVFPFSIPSFCKMHKQEHSNWRHWQVN